MRLLVLAVASLIIGSAAAAPINLTDTNDITFVVQYRIVDDSTYNYGTADTLKDAEALHRALIADIQRPDSDLHRVFVEGRIAWTRVKFVVS